MATITIDVIGTDKLAEDLFDFILEYALDNDIPMTASCGRRQILIQPELDEPEPVEGFRLNPVPKWD